MEQNPSWEAESHSANREILRLIWNPEVHYRVHKIPPLVPMLNQMSPVHIFPPYFSKTRSNAMLLFTIKLSKWSLLFRLTNQNFVRISYLYYTYYMVRPSDSISFNGPSSIQWAVQTVKLHIMDFSPASPYSAPSHKTHFKIFFKLLRGLSSGTFIYGFFDQNFVCIYHFLCAYYISCYD